MARFAAILALVLGWVFLGLAAFFVYLLIRFPNDSNHGIPGPVLTGLPALFFGAVGWGAIRSGRRILNKE